MKNWKYIEGAKVGNETLAAHPDSLVAQEIYKVYLDNGKDENKALEVLASKYKNLPKEALKKHLKDAIKAYANIVRNSKTGAEEFFKQLSDDVKEREEKDDEEIKLVGNETYQHKLYPDKYVIIEGNNYKIVTDGKVEKSGKLTDAVLYGINQTYKRVGNKKLKFTDKKDGLKEFVYDEENDKGYIYYDGKLVDTIPHAGQGWLNLIKQKAFSSGVMNKTGNRVIEKESEMSQELKNLLKQANPEWKDKVSFAFSHGFDIDENDFINAIKKDLQNKRTGNAQWDRAYYKQMIDPAKWSEFEKKFEKLIYDQNLERYDMEDRMSLKPELRSDKYKMIERQRKDVEAMINKYRKSGNKTGNSAQDDKFAYVMREFDEGKLKTPDGKVVTDPAQAKAIAYSESKKTENGLARARNAMNKKCGNSQVTLWKGNDSVLISEDGTVQYLESNSFETDRDKYGSVQEAIDDLTKKGYRKK